LADGQAYLDHWDTRWADTRIHGTTKRQVAAMFAEEQPTLRPLPLTPFRYYQYGTRTVHLNGCVEVEGAYYSAPPGHVGERLPVQWDGVTVRLLDAKTGQLLREHRWQAHGQYRIPPADRPPRTPPEVAQLLARAARAGRAIGTLCTTIHQQDGPLGVRRILGVLALAKRYGVATVETACTAALECGVPTYRFVRRYCERPPDHRHLAGPRPSPAPFGHRLEHAEGPRPRLRARPRPLQPRTRRRALPRAARHRQESPCPSERPRRDPAGLPRPVHRGPWAPRRTRGRHPRRHPAREDDRARHRAAPHHRRPRHAEAPGHRGRGSPRARHAPLRAGEHAAHLEPAGRRLGETARGYRRRRRAPRSAPPPRP